MRVTPNPQTALSSYISLEDPVPAGHPLRRLQVLVDAVLATMDKEFSAVAYAMKGRPSIPPERLLKASLLQILFSIRSERILVEHIDYNLLYRWFVGLSIDEPVWDHSTFSHNRDRLFNEGLGRVRMLGGWGKLTSDERFSVDGTRIEARASHKSFRPKDGGGDDRPGSGGRNEEVDFHSERRNEPHESMSLLRTPRPVCLGSRRTPRRSSRT